MSTLTVDLPDDLQPEEARLHLSMRLFEIGKLSLGQAARMVGCSKGTYIDLLGEHGIPVIDYPPEELDEELNAF
jgi:predicted HTH domain antitoxin